jgi:hypothetical protein|tara:strand:- start:301 stop:456 length:156 start_codon:yes stop_codon:yes gene_type:complete
MVKKLKNKRKKFFAGGNVGPDIKQNKLGSFSVFADQLTTYNLHKKGFIGKK